MDKKLQVIYKKIDEIVPYINNTKKHPQSQIDKIKASINEFGMCNPILIHNNTIVAGHGRYEALKQLGYKEVPTIDLSHLSEAQRKAYIIADNRISEFGEWDEELLKIELQELKDNDLDFIIDEFEFEDVFEDDFEEEDEDELYDISNDNTEAKTISKYITIDDIKILTNEEEVSLLKTELNKYEEDNGTYIGFFRKLILKGV